MVCVEVEYEGKTRRSKPMPFEEAITIWAMTGEVPCRITPVNSRRPLWPATEGEVAELRAKYQAENYDE